MTLLRTICIVIVLRYWFLSLAETNAEMIPGTKKKSAGVTEGQNGRHVGQLAMQISQHTKFSPVVLANYGNFCGFGGSGTPTDAVDQCCFKHDNCYGGDVESCQPHLLMYSYNDANIACTDEAGSCKYKVCKCDVDFISCLNAVP